MRDLLVLNDSERTFVAVRRRHTIEETARLYRVSPGCVKWMEKRLKRKMTKTGEE